MFEWTLLTFSFQNDTLKSNPPTMNDMKKYYTITVYVNGLLDVALQYTDLVLSNDGPLHIFKDNSHSGFNFEIITVIIIKY